MPPPGPKPGLRGVAGGVSMVDGRRAAVVDVAEWMLKVAAASERSRAVLLLLVKAESDGCRVLRGDTGGDSGAAVAPLLRLLPDGGVRGRGIRDAAAALGRPVLLAVPLLLLLLLPPAPPPAAAGLAVPHRLRPSTREP